MAATTKQVPQTITVRGREYVLFDVYPYLSVAKDIRDRLAKSRFTHLVKARGKNAVYHVPDSTWA
jgi:hypothetical protein